MKNKLRYLIFLLLAAYGSLLTAYAQAPAVEKIDPHSEENNF